VALANPSVVTSIKNVMVTNVVVGSHPVTNGVLAVTGSYSTGGPLNYKIDFGRIKLNGGSVTKTFRVKNDATAYSYLMSGKVRLDSMNDPRLFTKEESYKPLVDGEVSQLFSVTFTPSYLGILTNQYVRARGFWNYDGITPAVNNPVTLKFLGEVVP
jgi:hypothetical protein